MFGLILASLNQSKRIYGPKLDLNDISYVFLYLNIYLTKILFNVTAIPFPKSSVCEDIAKREYMIWPWDHEAISGSYKLLFIIK